MSIDIEPFCESHCPVQCALSAEEEVFRQELATRTALAEQSFMGESGQLFERFISDTVDQTTGTGLTAEEIAAGIRSQAANVLNYLEEEADNIRSRRKRIGKTCSNILSMRASKDGQVFTVSVCTSPEAYRSDSIHVPTHTVYNPKK